MSAIIEWRMKYVVGAVAMVTTVLACSNADRSTSVPTSPRAFTTPRAQHDEGVSDAHVVVGTGDPAVDVPAVQAAVDQGGTVILEGHFSFRAPPTKHVSPVLTAGGAYPAAAEVLVSKAVTISGAGEDEEMPTIEAGTIPFYIEAPGAHVTVRGVRFVRPIASAVFVYAAHGLEVVSNRIEGLEPFANFGEAIAVITTGGIPSPTSPGNPANISGEMSIVGNYIDAVGGTTRDATLGITIFSAGVAGAEVDFDVSRNTIKNTTEPAINFRRIVGQARIEHNVIATGSLAATQPRGQAIRAVNIGRYVIAHNSIDCDWAASDAQGIGVFSQFAAWPIEYAVVRDNNVTMSAPRGTVFSSFSGGIGVYGFANENVVEHNTIRGRARSGLSISLFPLPPTAPASPTNNALLRNRFVEFTPSVADIFVGPHALATHIVGLGSVVDQGDETSVRR